MILSKWSPIWPWYKIAPLPVGWYFVQTDSCPWLTWLYLLEREKFFKNSFMHIWQVKEGLIFFKCNTALISFLTSFYFNLFSNWSRGAQWFSKFFLMGMVWGLGRGGHWRIEWGGFNWQGCLKWLPLGPILTSLLPKKILENHQTSLDQSGIRLNFKILRSVIKA